MSRLLIIDFSIKSREHHDRELRVFLLLNIVLDAIILMCHEYLIITSGINLSRGGWLVHVLLAFHIFLALAAVTSHSPTSAMDIIIQNLRDNDEVDSDVACDGMPISMLDWAIATGVIVSLAEIIDLRAGALTRPENGMLEGATAIIGLAYLAHQLILVGFFVMTWLRNGLKFEKERGTT